MSFDEFVRARLASWLGLATAMSGDAAQGEDIVQEVLIRLHARWDRISAMEYPNAYVHRMVANEFVSARRKSARILPRAAVPDRRVAPDPAAGVDDRDELLQLIARLPRKQRAIVAMRHYADLPDDQIAAALHCTQSTVRSNAARALATLRREIGAGPETTSSQEHSR